MVDTMTDPYDVTRASAFEALRAAVEQVSRPITSQHDYDHLERMLLRWDCVRAIDKEQKRKEKEARDA